MNRSKFAAAVSLSVVLLLASSAWAEETAPGAPKKALSIDGSTTVLPISQAFHEVFQKSHAGVEVTVKGTGSGDGITALIDKRCDIAASSRFLKEKEFSDAVAKGVLPVVHAIGMDGVCVITHPSNPVSGLTADQIRQIYQGEIKNWKEVGGADLPIVAISRDTSSGTYEVFHEKVMKKQKMADAVEYLNSSAGAQLRVKNTPGAISYVGLAFQEGVRTLKVNNVLPTRRTILSGQYLIARPLYWVTNGFPDPGTLTYDWVTMHLTEKGQEMLEAKGFVPLTEY